MTKTHRPGMKSNLVWTVSANLLSGFCQWSLLVVIAKLGSMEMVGAYTLGVAIALPVLMFSNLQLRALQVTDVDKTYRFIEYFALRIATAALSMGLIAAIALALRCPPGTMLPVLMIGAGKCLEQVSDVFYGLLQHQEWMDRIAVSMILRNVSSLAGFGAVLYLSHSLVLATAALVLCAAATILVYDMPCGLALQSISLRDGAAEWMRYTANLFTGGRRMELARLWKLVVMGAPLGVVLMLVSLNLNIPRYFIENRLGLRELGIFAAITNLVQAGNVAVNAAVQCAAPRLARYFVSDLKAFQKLLATLILASSVLGIAGVAGAVLFGQQALTIIYRPEFATRHDVLILLMAAAAFLYIGTCLGIGLTAARCFNPQLPLFAASAGCTALGCLLLLRPYGLKGAAWAVLASAIIQCVGGAGILQYICFRTVGRKPVPLVPVALTLEE